MNNKKNIIFFWLVAISGLLLHVVFWVFKTGMHYPDEIFQYIEPAFIRIKGFGWLPWEFDRGVRNWTLIAFYGGWMKLFSFLGADGEWLHRLIGLHNTILALAIFPACLRLGRLYGGEVGAWTAGIISALLPPIVFFTPHPLSEVPSMVLTTWGIVFWLEGRRFSNETKPAFKAGVLLGLGVVVRFFSAVLLIVPFIDYLIRIRQTKKGFIWFVTGGMVAIAVLGISDWLTWGKPFHSAIEYFRYNILEWGNAEHGVSPWWQYITWLWERLDRWGFVFFFAFIFLGMWKTKLIFATFLFGFISLSLISHKEERFILGLWPLMIIPFATSVSLITKFLSEKFFKSLRPNFTKTVVSVLFNSILFVSSAIGTSKLEWHWLGNLFEAQKFVGKQSDLSGCMFSGRVHLSGGASYLNRNVPLDSYQASLNHNPLFNYYILQENSSEANLARAKKWKEIARFSNLIVFKREK